MEQIFFKAHWNFSGRRKAGQTPRHVSEELQKRLIKMFSFVGDTVLDPFLGSGTTCLAAKNLNRNSVGYEINKDFLPVIKQKLNIKNNENLKLSSRKRNPPNYKEEILKLPYIFQRPCEV